MFENLKSKARLLAACTGVALLGALSACGDSTVATPAAPAGIAVSGTAAVGAPLKNASVTLLCGKGGSGGSATTGSDGSFGMTLDSACTAPYFLKVTGVDTSVTPNATITLYAFADAAGNINITPLTHIAAGVATNGNPDAEYEAVLKASKKVDDSWNSTSKSDAKAKVLAQLKDLGLDDAAGKISDILQGKFKADGVDPLDKLLDDLKKKRGGVPLSSLIEQIVKSGGSSDGAPWKVLFAPGSDTVQLVGTSCSYSAPSLGEGSLSGTVTVTLTKKSNTLTMSVDPGTTAFTVTPVVWSETKSAQFQITLDSRTTTVARMYLSNASGGVLSFDSRPVKLASPVMDTPTGISPGSSSFNLNNGTVFVGCNTVTKPLLRTTLSLDLPTRLASLMAGTTAAVLTPTTLCQEYNSTLSTFASYTFTVSKLGEASFNGTPLPSNWLSADNAVYDETTYFGPVAAGGGSLINYVRIIPDNSTDRSGQLQRTVQVNDTRASCDSGL